MDPTRTEPRAEPALRHSLRWRLPLYFGVLVAVMLGTFVWAAYQEVDLTSRRAGRDRADAAARQIADMLAVSIGSLEERLARVAAEPAVRRQLRSPDPAAAEAAGAVLQPLVDEPFQRAELWRGDSLVLSVRGPGVPDSLALPPQGPPEEPGVGALRPLGADRSFIDIVVEVRDGDSPDAALLGHLRRSSRISSSSAGAVRRLVGSEASVRVGAIGEPVWTDLDTNVSPPPLGAMGSDTPGVPLTDPADETRRTATDTDPVDERLRTAVDAEPAEADPAEGWIGAIAPIGGTSLVAWVGFPASAVTEPARTFLRETVTLAILFLLVGSGLAALLAVRITRPLHALARGAQEIAAGDYSRRVATDRHDEIGRLGQAFNTMTDRIEEAHGRLRESHERIQFALAVARIGVWTSDLRSDQMSCSDSMHLVLDFPEGEVHCGRSDFLARIHPDDRESVRHVLEGRAIEDAVVDIEFRAVEADGAARWIEGKARRRLDESGRPVSVLGVVIDVTERRRLESQLRQAQKMEAVGQLAGGVAHDFNNLLTSILGHANLVLDDLAPEHRSRDDVDEIVKAARSGGRLTRQLLAFSRRQVMQPELVTVESVIESTEKLLRRLIGENIEFVTELAPDLHRVKVDPGLIEQVLMNLAVNARDAMPGGGRITVSAHNVHLTETFVGEHASAPPGRYVVLSVSDTGTGMDDETQAHLFEPFFTTKGPGKGTGLGLATVFGIVKQSGGHIFVHSEPGDGSTFEIYLPAERSREPLAPVRAG